MPLHNSEIWTTSSPFWVVQFHIMSPKFGQCHLPPASKVGVASSLLQGHVHAMSKSWRGILLTSSRFCWHLFASSKSWWKLLETSRFCWHLFSSSKSLMRAPCNVKVLVAFFLKLQGFVGISEILMRSPCIFKVLLAFLKSWYLATVLCTFDVWVMLPFKIGAIVALL